jgi:putative membrane protein
MRPKENRTLSQWLGIYLRGLFMGVAELVPGVSGGTIAFVTGIYDELVNTLAGLNIFALVELKAGLRQGLATMFEKYNLTFLIVLGLGMVTSVVLLAQLLALALEGYRPVVWAFFFGIILLSIWLLGRDLPVKTLAMVAPFGLAAGLSMVLVEPFGASQSLWVFLLAGSIAVSAWLLPAISGSFILLLLGLYESVIAALAGPQWDVLLVFLSGCVAGLLLFSRLLAMLLRVWRVPLMSLLTGFMAGALLKLWPWQLDSAAVSPEAYGLATGEPSYLAVAVLAVLAGALVIWMLSRFER